MPTFTTNQWVILFLVFVLGWLLGLLSRSTRKLRRAYEAERDARIEEQREHAAALETAQARIAELERRPVVAAPVAVPVVTPATLDLTRDDLSLIRGLGREGEQDLNDEGIARYDQIVAMSTADEHSLEDRLGADRGYIAQERWRDQARLLAEGRFDEHRATYG